MPVGGEDEGVVGVLLLSSLVVLGLWGIGLREIRQIGGRGVLRCGRVGEEQNRLICAVRRGTMRGAIGVAFRGRRVRCCGGGGRLRV